MVNLDTNINVKNIFYRPRDILCVGITTFTGHKLRYLGINIRTMQSQKCFLVLIGKKSHFTVAVNAIFWKADTTATEKVVIS